MDILIKFLDMKKLLILLMMCIPFVAMAKDVRIKVKTDDGLIQQYVDDIISVRFYGAKTAPNYFITIEIINNTNERIELEWENAKFESGRVLFPDDTGLTKNNQRANEVVFGGDKLKKEFTSQSFWNEHREMLTKIYSMKSVKNSESEFKKTLILPVIHNGETTDYRFELIFVIE